MLMSISWTKINISIHTVAAPDTRKPKNGRLPTPRFMWYIPLKTRGKASNYTVGY
jgi:hypothetical protein